MSPTALRLLQPLGVPTRGVAPDDEFLAACERAYQRTRNPVYVWDALACALSSHGAVPDWTRAYLRDVAVGISRLSRAGRTPRKRTIASTIARIVFPRRGRANPFDAIETDAHELLIAFDVYTCHTRNWYNQKQGLEGTSDWGSIFEEVARAHKKQCDRCRRHRLKGKTIEKYWYKHASLVIPPRVVARATSRKIDDILR